MLSGAGLGYEGHEPHGYHIETGDVNTGEKWAFVHRMIEEQDNGSQNIMQSELHSIAVFCQHTNCPIPKQVSSFLLRESSSARLGNICVLVGFFVSVYSLLCLILWISLMSFGTADDSLLSIMTSFARGMAFELVLFLGFSLSALAVALNGFSYKSAAAILAAVVFLGGAFAFIWLFVAPTNPYGVQVEILLTAEVLVNVIAATVLFTWFAP